MVELAEITAEIEELRDQLDAPSSAAPILIIEALNDGNSLRDIAEVMSVSATAVRKAMRGGIEQDSETPANTSGRGRLVLSGD